MDIKKIIASLLLAKVMFSCKDNEDRIKNNTNTNKDPFYVEDSGYDFIRFPLIKPYEVVSNDKGKEWFIQSNFNPTVASEIADAFGIKKINIIKNNIIICYCEKKPNVGGKKYPKAWFIFIPEKNINQGFITEKDFIEYLNEQGITEKEILWSTPKELFKQFSDTYCLPWIPNC